MLMFIFLNIFIVVLLISYKYITRNYNVWKKRNIKEAGGATWMFGTNNRASAEIFKEIYDSFPDVPHVGMFQGSKPALLLRDVDNIRFVLAGEFQNFHSRGLVTNPRDILANNLLFMDEYQSWRLVRQKISPVFTNFRLKNMFYILERCARDFATMMKKENQKNPFDLMHQYTSASVAAAIFGIDTLSDNTMDSPFLEMSREVSQPSLKRNLKFIFANALPKVSTALNFKQFGEYEHFFIGAVKKVLKDRRDKQENRYDFIDLCLELQKQGIMQDPATSYETEPSDELLAAQAFFFFVAGTDTSANAMHFTLLELSNNPDILNKLHCEIDEVFMKCNEKVTFKDIEDLTYIDMVINESMRKYPPIGAIQRRCTEDIVLPVGNVPIKKNELIVLPIFAIHRDERYFENPEIFDPERFAPEKLKNISKYCYFPFGGGNRVCIGARFARLQMKVGLAWLLRRFTLRPQSLDVNRFEPIFFALRATNVKYDLVLRNN